MHQRVPKCLETITQCVNYCINVLIKLHTEIHKNDFKVDLCSIIHFIKTQYS